MRKIKYIYLDDSEVFEGTPEQLQDNFGYVQGGGPVTAEFVEAIAKWLKVDKVKIVYEDGQP